MPLQTSNFAAALLHELVNAKITGNKINDYTSCVDDRIKS